MVVKTEVYVREGHPARKRLGDEHAPIAPVLHEGIGKSMSMPRDDDIDFLVQPMNDSRNRLAHFGVRPCSAYISL